MERFAKEWSTRDLTFSFPRQRVIAAANKEIHFTVREDGLGLHELLGVALMEEIVDAVSIHSYFSGSISSVSHVECDLGSVVACFTLDVGQLFVVEWGRVT